jgi:hypothetical protein
MNLNIICSERTLDAVLEEIEKYFGMKVRLIRTDMSMFEQYEVRPCDRKFIPKIWTYRIICRNGVYYFGKL